MVIENNVTISREFAESVIDTVHEPLIVLDHDLRVVYVSRSFYKFFKVKPEETVGQLIYDLGNKQWDIPRLRELLETILPQKTTFDNYEVEHHFATIGRRVMLLNARQIQRVLGKERIILLTIEDITERKRLEDLLAESEQNYRRSFETATDGIVLLEKREGHIMHANPAVEKMLGCSKTDFIGKKLLDVGIFLGTSDFPALMQSLDNNGILNYEDVQVKTRSGKNIHTDIYLVDKAALAQCNIRDVSERKKKEKHIQKLNQILQAHSKSSRAMIGASDEAWYLNEVCRIIVEDCGYAMVWIGFAEQDEGRSVRPVAHAGFEEGYLDAINITWSDTDRGRDPVGTAIRTGKPSVFRDIFKTIAFAPWRNEAAKRGYVSVIAVPLIEEGKAFGSINIYSRQQKPFFKDEMRLLIELAADLSYGIAAIRVRAAQAEAEAALRESELKYKSLVETTMDGVYKTDLDGAFTFINQAGAEMFGYGTPDKMIGRPPIDYWADPGEKDKYIAKLKNRKTLKSYPVKMINNDGVEIHLEISSRIIEDDLGRFTGIEGVVRDVTSIIKLEAQLRQAQKMEAVGTLAGGIAHDFNNILNVIIGYGTIVMDKLEAGSLSREQMNEVLAAADKAVTLTKRMLVFSRKQVVEVKPVNINKLILGLQKMIIRIIREDIEFNLDFEERPLIVRADAGQIEQVLINLAANARDAMPEGGRLTIGTVLQELDEEYVEAYGFGKPGMYALITVADTGQGMDKKTKEKIFEPFFTTKGIGEGTGLGLAISYGIINQHDGYIKVYSEPGNGTIFKIYLPIVEETELDKETEAPGTVKGGNETILVAEDDDSLRILSRIILESNGYSVITAENGEDAITKFIENSESISLALIDMIMPKKNGKEVSETIRKTSPRVKIILTSGYTMDIIMTRELTESGFDFILKPVMPRDLLTKVREVLDR